MTQTHAILLAALFGVAQGNPALVANMWATNVTVTTTQTPWDSSAFSSGSSGNSLGSSLSGNSQAGGSSASSDVDLSGSFSWAGSEQSGSSGSYLRLWVWGLALVLCCCAAVLIGAVAFMAKPQKPRKAPQQRMAPPLPPPEAVNEQAVPFVQEQPQEQFVDMNQDSIPDVFQGLAPMAPLPTYSTPIPAYSTPQYTMAPQYTMQPQTTSYAAPATVAMPMVGSYGMQPQTYAGGLPTTTSYATAPYSGSAYIAGQNYGGAPVTYAGGVV